MKTIKFGQRYTKMPLTFGNTTVLDVITVWGGSLSQIFLEYNVRLTDGSLAPIPEGLVIVLILITDQRVWTAIRPYDAEKEQFYQDLVGERVKIEVVPEKRASQ